MRYDLTTSAGRTGDFHNKLRILLGIDLHELEAAGLTLSQMDWYTFRENPFRWFIAASTEDAEAVWSIVERRSVRNPRIGVD